jgi:hypothetical protein
VLRLAWPAALLCLVAVAGCGSAKKDTAQPPNPFRAAETPREHGCSFVTTTDVTHVLGNEDVRRRDLAPDHGVACATAFWGGGSGAVFAVVTELDGGVQALSRLRAAKVGELGSAAVKPMPVLGPGAFLAKRRLLGFRHGQRVLVVETGYDQQGKLAISVSKLTKLARIVAARL